MAATKTDKVLNGETPSTETSKASLAATSTNPKCSAAAYILVAIVVHGLLNALFLSAINPMRCVYWTPNAFSTAPETTACSSSLAWILNWLAWSHFRVYAILAALVYGAQNSPMLEGRVLAVAASLQISHLTNGVYLLPTLHKPLAALQMGIHLSFLVVIAWYVASTTRTAIPPPTVAVRSQCFDWRQPLPIPSVALISQCFVFTAELTSQTFGPRAARTAYLGNSSGVAFGLIEQAVESTNLWAILLLGGSVLLATAHQQQRLVLMAQMVSLFWCQAMLAGSMGDYVPDNEKWTTSTNNFLALFMAAIGIL